MIRLVLISHCILLAPFLHVEAQELKPLQQRLSIDNITSPDINKTIGAQTGSRAILQIQFDSGKKFYLVVNHTDKKLVPSNEEGTIVGDETLKNNLLGELNRKFRNFEYITITPLLGIIGGKTKHTMYESISSQPVGELYRLKCTAQLTNKVLKQLLGERPVLFFTESQMKRGGDLSFSFSVEKYSAPIKILEVRVLESNESQTTFWNKSALTNGMPMARLNVSALDLNAISNPFEIKLNQTGRLMLSTDLRYEITDNQLRTDILNIPSTVMLNSSWGDVKSGAIPQKELDNTQYELRTTYTRNPDALPDLVQLNNEATGSEFDSNSPWNYGVIWVHAKKVEPPPAHARGTTPTSWKIVCDEKSKETIKLLGNEKVKLHAIGHDTILVADDLKNIAENNEVKKDQKDAPFGPKSSLLKVLTDEAGAVSKLEDNHTIVNGDTAFRIGQEVDEPNKTITLKAIEPNVCASLEGLDSTVLRDLNLIGWEVINTESTPYNFEVSKISETKVALWTPDNWDPKIIETGVFSIQVTFEKFGKLPLELTAEKIEAAISETLPARKLLSFAELLKKIEVSLPSDLHLKGTLFQFLQREITLKWEPNHETLIADLKTAKSSSSGGKTEPTPQYGAINLIQETPEAPLVRFVKPDARDKNGIMILVDNYQPWSVGAAGRSSLQGGIWDAIETVVSQVEPPPDTIVVGLVNQGYEVLTAASDARQKQIALFRLRRLIFNEHDLKAHGTPAKDLASLVHPSPETRHANAVNNTLTTLLPEATQWAVCFVTPTLEAHQRDPINSIASMLGNVDFVQIGSPPGIDPSSENFKPTLIQEIKSKITNP
jgi:hypothetical protein